MGDRKAPSQDMCMYTPRMSAQILTIESCDHVSVVLLWIQLNEAVVQLMCRSDMYPQKDACILTVAIVVYIFVCCFVHSRARNELRHAGGQCHISRFPCISHGWHQSSSTRYRCMTKSCFNVLSHVIMCLLLCCRVRWMWEYHVSHEDQTSSSPARCAHFCCGCSCVHVCIDWVQQGSYYRGEQCLLKVFSFLSVSWNCSQFYPTHPQIGGRGGGGRGWETLLPPVSVVQCVARRGVVAINCAMCTDSQKQTSR